MDENDRFADFIDHGAMCEVAATGKDIVVAEHGRDEPNEADESAAKVSRKGTLDCCNKLRLYCTQRNLSDKCSSVPLFLKMRSSAA